VRAVREPAGFVPGRRATFASVVDGRRFVGALGVAFAVSSAATGSARAQLVLSPGDDVEAALDGLRAGDEVVLADGEYTLPDRFSFSAIGTPGRPIVIRAGEGARPHFHRPNAQQNIWDIEEARHVVIRGLRFSGGSAGLRIMRASHLTIEDCEIFETGDVALRMNDAGETYESVRVLRNHIHDTHGTGEGMYLGCNDDACRLADGLIAGNWVHHTNAPDVRQGDGIELKDGSYGTVIRDNVVHDTKFPCILGYSTSGNGAANTVERNVMWGCGDHALQWEADATIANNIVLGAAGAALATQPHQENGPSKLRILHNTLINDGDALTIRNPSGEVTVANNALYATGRALYVNANASRVLVVANAGQGVVRGVETDLLEGDIANDFRSASFSGELPQDVFPVPGRALAAAGAAAYLVPEDFNGTDRAGIADLGAYAVGDGDPGWKLDAAFKPEPGDAGGSPEDAGSRGDADGGLRDTGGTDGSAAEPIEARDAGAPSDGESGADASGRDRGTTESGSGCRGLPSGAGSAWTSLALLLAGVVACRRAVRRR